MFKSKLPRGTRHFKFLITARELSNCEDFIMARKTVQKNQNAVPGGFNAGILVEFLIFLALQGFDIYCNYGVYFESSKSETIYEEYISNLEAINATEKSRERNLTVLPLEFCSSSEFKPNKVTELFEQYTMTVDIYLTFTVVASIIFSLHFLLWLATIGFSLMEADFLQENWDHLVKGKIGFTIAANFIQDIPCSTIAIELYLLRRGTNGLICWQCTVDPQCDSQEYLETLLAPSTQALTLLIVAICLTTLWKAISSFFRWSRADECDVFIIRATTSLFAGFLYACIIMTPAMTILKYRFFTLPGVTPGFLADLIDKLFIIGALFWSIGILTVFCCPLLRLIRLAQ